MIVEAVVSLLVALVEGALSLLPSAEPPGWFLDAGSQWSALMGQVGLLGNWMPVNLATTIVGAVLGSWVIGFTIKVVRLVLSYFTAGGGSAG